MKNRRHKMIQEIIEQKSIETQYQLTEELMRYGFNVTQATISRDIKELGLVKVSSGGGRFRYSIPPGMNTVNTYERAKRVLHDSLVRVDTGHSIIILHTMPGMAQGVASCMEGLNWKEIIGCLAGDDTIFLIPHDSCDAGDLANRIRELLN